MNRWLATMTALGVWAWLGTSSAWAQLGTYNPPQVTPGQPFSPYLNMMNNPAANYFGRVLPQIDTNRSLLQLQTDLRYTQAGMPTMGIGTLDANAQNNLLTTGHGVTFQNLGGYFPQLGQPFAGMGVGITGGPVGTIGGTGIGGAPVGTTTFGTGTGQNINNTPLPLGFQPR